MLPRSSLSRTQYLTHSLLPVVLTSATNTCSICNQPYSDSLASQPVILPDCGHIFCRTCITAWFTSGQQNANKCPVDRMVLFRADDMQDEAEQDMGPVQGAVAHIATPVAVRRATRTPVEEVMVQGSVFARNGRLTYTGCQRVVQDLWEHTRRLLRSLKATSLSQLDADVEDLRPCIQAVIPAGVWCVRAELLVLNEIASWMLAWPRGDLAEESAAWEQFEDMAWSLYEVGGDID